MFKLNQKGQQFSVFELMIAGIVAFAILMLLLTIIMKVDIGGQGGNPKSVIENGISSALPSSTITTNNFTMKAGDEVTSEDLINKTGLDASRIYFVAGQMKLDTDVTIVELDDGGASLTNKRSGDLRVRAKVICKANGLSVAGALERLGDKYDVSSFSDSMCEEDNQSCCVVVLEKPGN